MKQEKAVNPFSLAEKEYARKWDTIFGKKNVEKIIEDAQKYLAEKDKKDD